MRKKTRSDNLLLIYSLYKTSSRIFNTMIDLNECWWNNYFNCDWYENNRTWIPNKFQTNQLRAKPLCNTPLFFVTYLLFFPLNVPQKCGFKLYLDMASSTGLNTLGLYLSALLQWFVFTRARFLLKLGKAIREREKKKKTLSLIY